MWVDLWDELDLRVIAESGQCFRMREDAFPGFPGSPQRLWRLVHGHHVLYMAVEDQKAWVSATKEEWEITWLPYFDAGMDYGAFRRKGGGSSPFMREAFAKGEGLRILRQDPFEMLLTFLLSQRKSIPAIAANVEALCRAYGDPLTTPVETIYAFPTPAALYPVGEEEYRRMGLGYRSPYLACAVRMVAEGELNLDSIASLSTPELIAELMRVKGVGIKVASCVALFGYGRKDCAPVDVWIARAIEEEFGGEDPFPAFAPFQGLAQQYVFFLQKHRG